MLVPPPPDLTRHRRLVVVGVTGSGKSTMAARLAAATGIPHVSVDDLMWRPGWVQLTAEEQVEAIRPVVAEPAWVLDSLWSATRPLVLPRTDLLVALDHRRSVSLARLLRRTVARLVTRDPICGGNTESLRMVLSRESIIAWHWRSFADKHAAVEAWVADPTVPVVRFRSPREAEAWLRRVEAAAAVA